MPPEERLVPRFAAEPPQEQLPYGRWAERLQGELLAACLRIDPGEAGALGDVGEIAWYPERTWHGRTYVPGDDDDLERARGLRPCQLHARPRR